MYTYRTYFKLTAPVIDFEAAREYLIEDEMVVYFNEDSRRPSSLQGVVISIDWILRDEESGYIEMKSTRELETKELEFISDWVRGQNSDGLGESFEQQDFACYVSNENDDFDYDEFEDEDWIMASFDWLTNNYIFVLVNSD